MKIIISCAHLWYLSVDAEQTYTTGHTLGHGSLDRLRNIVFGDMMDSDHALVHRVSVVDFPQFKVDNLVILHLTLADSEVCQ